MRAGLPATMTPGGTSFVTTAPAPTMALAPMISPGRITAPPPDRSALANGGDREAVRVDLGAREFVVGERDVRADEDIVLDAQAIPELHPALDRGAVADDHIVFDENLRADVAVTADPGPGQDDDELPEGAARADPGGVHIRSGVNFRR